MYWNNSFVKNIFFEMEKIKGGFIVWWYCWFNGDRFDMVLTLNICLIYKWLKSLLSFWIKLNIISKILLKRRRFNLNTILFILFNFLLNLVILWLILNLNSFLLLTDTICFLFFQTINFRKPFLFSLLIFAWFNYFFVPNLIFLLIVQLFIFLLDYFCFFLKLFSFLFFSHLLYQLLTIIIN